MIRPASVESQSPAALPLPGGEASVGAGILWMLATTLLFVCQDSLARILLGAYPPTEIAFARYFVHVALVGAFLGLRAPRLLVSRRPAFQMLRSTLLLGATLFGLFGLRVMPFLDFSAVVWVAPVLVTGLSVLILGEKVSPRGWASVAIGLIGVWVIVAQGGLHISLLMLWPLLAALCNALYQITTRMLHRIDPPLTTLFYSALAGAIFCAAFLPFVGVAPKPADLALMILLGGAGVASHFCMIRAFAAAPANVIAPFGYTALLWAALSGLVVFAEAPNLRTMIGAALIVAAGLSIFMGGRTTRRVRP